jgi:hypothetical protein
MGHYYKGECRNATIAGGMPRASASPPLVIWLGIGPVGWKLIGIWQMAPKGQQIA